MKWAVFWTSSSLVPWQAEALALIASQGPWGGRCDGDGRWGSEWFDEARRPRPAGSLWLSVSLRSADEARRPRPAGYLW